MELNLSNNHDYEFKRKIYQDENFLNQIIKAGFDKVDKDKSGEIDIDEFTTLIYDVSQKGDIEVPSKEEILKIFNILDIDKSGTIGIEEFKYIVLRILDIE